MQAALLANPSVNKTEKATNIEAAKKMFDGGDRNGAPFSNKPNEEFASYDTGKLLLDFCLCVFSTFGLLHQIFL